jgi:hypothetical protein
MTQVKFNAELYFDVPEGVTAVEQIEYLNNLLQWQPELLLSKVMDINNQGKWEPINE